MGEYEKKQINKVIRGSKRATYNEDEINTILDAGFVGHVGYSYDGYSICIPMAYGRIGNSVFLHGSMKNRLLNTLLSVGKTSMTVMHLDGLVLARSAFHHSVNYRSATIYGNVSKVTDDDEKEAALVQIIEQMVPNRWDDLRPMNEKEFKSTLVLELKIESASAKIRGEGVVDEKEDISYPTWAGIVPIRQISEAPEGDKLLDSKIEVPQHVQDFYERNKW